MAERRERILEAAMNRFAEYGFNATTVRQIADDVDILSGSLYHHFATKEEMLDEIIRQAVMRLHDVMVRIAAAPQAAESRLVALILATLRELTAHQAVHAILFFERKFIRRSPDFAYVNATRRETYDGWRKVMDDGVRDGQFRSELDVFFTISTISRMLNTGADWYRHEDGSPIDTLATLSLDELADFYLDFILRSIRPAARAGEPVPRAAAEALIAAVQKT
jgi:AcrR family transcriptional regulator